MSFSWGLGLGLRVAQYGSCRTAGVSIGPGAGTSTLAAGLEIWVWASPRSFRLW